MVIEVNTDTFLNLYKALIRPQLDICLGPFYSVDQNKVEKYKEQLQD